MSNSKTFIGNIYKIYKSDEELQMLSVVNISGRESFFFLGFENDVLQRISKE